MNFYDLAARFDDAVQRNPVLQLRAISKLALIPPCYCLDCDKFKQYLEYLDAQVFFLQLEARTACSMQREVEYPVPTKPKPTAPAPKRKTVTTTDDLMGGLDL